MRPRAGRAAARADFAAERRAGLAGTVTVEWISPIGSVDDDDGLAPPLVKRRRTSAW